MSECLLYNLIWFLINDIMLTSQTLFSLLCQNDQSVNKIFMLQVRLKLTTLASLRRSLFYKYHALTDCATGACWPSSPVLMMPFSLVLKPKLIARSVVAEISVCREYRALTDCATGACKMLFTIVFLETSPQGGARGKFRESPTLVKDSSFGNNKCDHKL